MKKLSTFCDRCKNLIKDDDKIFNRENQEICSRCNTNLDVEQAYKINYENHKNAAGFSGCSKCKYSGFLHKSIYVVGPGYFDEPDPDVYCTCKKGIALNPDTKFLVK